MTAGKNQAQPVVFKGVIWIFIGAVRCTPLCFEILHELVLRRIKSCPSTQRIDGFESGRRNQPWSRVVRHATARPQGQRSGKGFVHRLLGEIKITEQADQRCQDSSRIHAVKGIEQFAYLLGGMLGHDDELSKPAIPNQFGKRNWGLCFESKLCTDSFSPYCTSQSYAFKSPAADAGFCGR